MVSLINNTECMQKTLLFLPAYCRSERPEVEATWNAQADDTVCSSPLLRSKAWLELAVDPLAVVSNTGMAAAVAVAYRTAIAVGAK